MKPLIFLDIDGVLNNMEYAIEHNKKYKVGGFGWPPEKMSEVSLKNINWDASSVKVLKEFVEEIGAEIVISSSWRIITRNIELWKAMFSLYKWKDAPVIGITPTRSPGGSFRGEEINCWLRANNMENVPYIIFDDDSDFYPDQPFIHIDGRTGLRKEGTNRAKKLLGL